LLCDGQGRFAIERTLASGLKEQILCDGQTLLHLYPEIGIGTKRSFSRFHFGELQALIPWLLSAADDLARNADLLAYGSNTVAIVPHGKGIRIETHLVFNDDGNLQERRWVLMPHKLMLARQKFTAKSFGEPVAEPNLKPDVSNLVVLPLPYRTVNEVIQKQQRQSWWQRAFNDPLELAAAHYADPSAGLDGGWLIENVVKKGDTRPGWFTLIRAQNANVMPLAPKDSHEPVLKYLQNRTGNVGALDSFLQRMMDLYYLVDVSQGQPPLVKPPEWATNVRGAIERNRNELGAAALLVLEQRGGLTAGDWNLLADLWKQFHDIPGFWYTSRYERIRCLMAAGLEAQARQEFDKLYGETLAAGVIPPLDSLYAQLPANPAQLLKNAAHERAAQHPEDVLALAWQSAWLGPQGTTSQEVMAELRPSTKWPEVTLSAVLLWQQLGQPAAAQEWLDELLGDATLAKQPGLWRLAAELASQRGQEIRQIECLEKALDLEFAHLPETVDVQQLREDYGSLLRGFGRIINDYWQKDTPMPANLAARIVKAVDRWRSIDPEANDACMQASDLLSDLNEPKLAWQYLTTVVALHPNEAAPYRQMAQHLAERNDWKLAEKAYAAAFAAEPTDAQLLYDRAKALEKGGRRPEAAAVMKQLADGRWQPRFDGVKAQARQWLSK
jgi:tetratricopeptide (TPR) repeat protein